VGSHGVPGDDLTKWIPRNQDLYVINLQENSKKDLFINSILRYLNEQPNGSELTNDIYSLGSTLRLWEIHLILFARASLLPYITYMDGKTCATGLAEILGNKGGVSLTFKVLDTSMCFIGCHLAARAERVVQRMENFKKIVKGCNPGSSEIDLLTRFDHIFWMGDLNYRIELSWDETLRLVEEENWAALLQADQLSNEKSRRRVFLNFEEGPIDFRPSYRLLRDREGWSDKRKQPPSYTDRVLFLSQPNCMEDCKLLTYQRHGDMLGSDHRPVSASFSLFIRPFYDGPLMGTTPIYDAQHPHGPARVILRNVVVQPYIVDREAFDHTLLIQAHSSIFQTGHQTVGCIPCAEGGFLWQQGRQSTAHDLVLEPYVYEKAWLESQYVVLSFLPNVDSGCKRVLGHAVISLSQASFHTQMHVGGTSAGQCRGEIVVESAFGQHKTSVEYKKTHHRMRSKKKPLDGSLSTWGSLSQVPTPPKQNKREKKGYDPLGDLGMRSAAAIVGTLASPVHRRSFTASRLNR
jgi:hypothetical protein